MNKSVRPPHDVTCDECGVEIGDVGYATVAWRKNGRWIVAHKRCVFDRPHPERNKSDFDWELRNVLAAPLRYTMYAVFTIGKEKRTSQGVTSWFAAMERLVGYEILERESDDAEPDGLPGTA